MTTRLEVASANIGLFQLIAMLDTTMMTKFQKDAIRAEYLLNMGWDVPDDFVNDCV